jgi:MFS family permease
LTDITIVNVALPDIQRAMHSSFADLQWVVDAYALTLASFLLTAGSLADIYGRRVLYLIGLVVFTGASALCGFATSTLMLQLSRGLQGVGGAIMFAVSLALLANAFRGQDRGVAFGVWGAVTGLAVAVGPLIGGVLTSGLSWRWIFFVNVPIGIAAVALTAMRVAESRAPSATGPDWAGFVIFTAALASLIYGLIESNQRSFTDALVLGCLAAAKVPNAITLLAVPPLVAEKNSDSSVIAPNSPAVAPAIVSWPKTVLDWPASVRTGTTSPREVADRVMARKSGLRTHPAAWKATPAAVPSSSEPA